MSLYRIKPLEWERIAGSHAIEEYYEAVENSWANGYAVCTRGRRWHYWSIPKNSWLPCDSLEAGKAACEAHWRAKLAEVLEEVPDDWQPIETAPKDCWVLGRAVDSTVPCAMMWGENTERWLDIHFDPWEDPPPSHWMPLPKPPAGGPKEGK